MTSKLLKRCDVKRADTWDLSSLFASDDLWEKAFTRFERQLDGYDQYRGHLGDSAATLAACLKFDSDLDRRGERLGVYAFLKTAEDQANSVYQRMLGRFQNLATRAAEKTSFIRPEILALSQAKIRKMLDDRCLAPYRLLLQRLLRY